MVHNLSEEGGRLVTASPSTAARRPYPAHWLGYAALSGWLAGPLLAAAYWLASGDADSGQLSLNPVSGLLPLAGLLVVWGAFVWMTHGTLGTGWRAAAKRATAVLALGSLGWLLAQFLRLPAGESINELALEWMALTLPYPLAAAAVQHAVTRPRPRLTVTSGGVLVPAGPGWSARPRTHAIAAAGLVVVLLGLSIESVGSGQARAADMPVRSADAEPEAPNSMLMLVDPARRYKPVSYGYVNGVVTISYAGQDTPESIIDDLEVIVAPGDSASSPCGVDWASADYAAGSGDELSCAQTANGRWLASDDMGNTLYIGEYLGYDVALAVNPQSDDPVSAATLPALLRTLREADASQRALLNAEEDADF
jgi:hypothetical protein